MLPDFADMELRKEALETARILLDCGAIRYDVTTPFRFGEGFESPVHVDARRVLADVDRRNRLVDLALQAIDRDVGRDSLDAAACCTEGQGVPFATLLAERLHRPLVFVRRSQSPNPHKSDVEGQVKPGTRVLLFDQLVADGRRKGSLVGPLRAQGAQVDDLFVIFQYGVLDSLHEHLTALGLRLHALTTWWDVLEVAADGHDLPAEALDEISRFLKDPCLWKPGGCGGA